MNSEYKVGDIVVFTKFDYIELNEETPLENLCVGKIVEMYRGNIDLSTHGTPTYEIVTVIENFITKEEFRNPEYRYARKWFMCVNDYLDLIHVHQKKILKEYEVATIDNMNKIERICHWLNNE